MVLARCHIQAVEQWRLRIPKDVCLSAGAHSPFCMGKGCPPENSRGVIVIKRFPNIVDSFVMHSTSEMEAMYGSSTPSYTDSMNVEFVDIFLCKHLVFMAGQ